MGNAAACFPMAIVGVAIVVHPKLSSVCSLQCRQSSSRDIVVHPELSSVCSPPTQECTQRSIVVHPELSSVCSPLFPFIIRPIVAQRYSLANKFRVLHVCVQLLLKKKHWCPAYGVQVSGIRQTRVRHKADTCTAYARHPLSV